MNKEEQLSVSPLETYPRAARGSLRQSFNKAQLQLVGGIHDGYVPRETDFGNFLKPNTESPATPEGAAYHIRFPQVVEGLLVGPTDKESKYLYGLGAFDYHNVPPVADMIARQDTSSERAVMRVVFGGTPEMQFRGVSMVLPSLLQMENISEQKHTTVKSPTSPQLQIIFANHVAAHINNADYQALARETRGFVDVTRAYVEEFFPKIANRVVFLEDAPVKPGAPIATELDRLATLAGTHLPELLKEKITSKAKGTRDGASMRYAAAHLLMHDTNMSDLLVPINGNPVDAYIPRAIISTGGRQEADFNLTRFHLRQYAGDAYQLPTVQFLTKHGSAPYYPAREGDISLRDVVSGHINPRGVASIDKHAQLDIAYFYAVSDKRGDTDSFIRGIQQK